jgi:putative tryptophan/tyrosine transport system substrate-binding protein
MIARVLSLCLLALALSDAAALAQTEKVYRVAVLSAALPRDASTYTGFEQRLRELGYVEGRNLQIDHRNAEGRSERLPALAAEIVALRPDIIVTPGPEATLRAARDATRTIPIVFAAADYDPLERRYIDTLARPGGNLTGISLRRIELTAKRIEMLKEVIPGITRIAVLHDSFSADQLRSAQEAARSLSLRIEPIEMSESPVFDALFALARERGAQAVLAGLSPIIFRERETIAAAAIKSRMPTIFGIRETVLVGGLMSYGPDLFENYRRTAEYVHKILSGTPPSELPVEQSTTFQMVLNLKTARAIGLELHPGVVARADEVIE